MIMLSLPSWISNLPYTLMAGNKRSVDKGCSVSQDPVGERGPKKPRRAGSAVTLNPAYFGSEGSEIQQAWRWVHVENGRGQLLMIIVFMQE